MMKAWFIHNLHLWAAIFSIFIFPSLGFASSIFSTFEDLVQHWASGYAHAMGAQIYDVDFSKLKISPQQTYWDKFQSTGNKYILARERKSILNNLNKMKSVNTYNLEAEMTGNIEFSWIAKTRIKNSPVKNINLALPVPYCMTDTVDIVIKGKNSHVISLDTAVEQHTSREVVSKLSKKILLPPMSEIHLQTLLEGEEDWAHFNLPHLISGMIGIEMGPIPENGKLRRNYEYVTQDRQPRDSFLLLEDSLQINFSITELFYFGVPYLDDNNNLQIYPSISASYPEEAAYFKLKSIDEITFNVVLLQKFIARIRPRIKPWIPSNKGVLY